MKIVETFIRANRFFVRVESGDGRTKTLPRANHVWLQSNPSFRDIPDGYSVHHLDWDQTNDDPSNLVIMQKYLHSAYHWKHKIVETPFFINVDKTALQEIDLPGMKKPPVPVKRGNLFYLRVWNHGKDHTIWRTRTGKSLATIEEANALALEIFENGCYYKTWSKDTWKRSSHGSL